MLTMVLDVPPVSRLGRRTPTIIIVKCGMEPESTDKKAGNRGKRDSQLILMNFFSRVTYNDRMSPLDFDMFRKMQVLMGVTPDYFEVVLMVSSSRERGQRSPAHSFSGPHRSMPTPRSSLTLSPTSSTACTTTT
jgi:chitin synthase